MMSWSIDLKHLDGIAELPVTPQIMDLARQHPAYYADMHQAFALAKACGFRSAVIGGGRTPSPYTNDEATEIYVRGMMKATDLVAEMRGNIMMGPDADE